MIYDTEGHWVDLVHDLNVIITDIDGALIPEDEGADPEVMALVDRLDTCVDELIGILRRKGFVLESY